MVEDVRRILLVEDDPADIFLAKEIFDEHGGFDIQVVASGEEALALLRREAEVGNEPDLVLLDLNIPGLDGREVLREIKQCEALCSIPVIIMSTSDAPDDIATSYELGANCFITKPVGIDGFAAMVDALDAFWFHFAKLPSRI